MSAPSSPRSRGESLSPRGAIVSTPCAASPPLSSLPSGEVNHAIAELTAENASAKFGSIMVPTLWRSDPPVPATIYSDCSLESSRTFDDSTLTCADFSVAKPERRELAEFLLMESHSNKDASSTFGDVSHAEEASLQRMKEMDDSELAASQAEALAMQMERMVQAIKTEGLIVEDKVHPMEHATRQAENMALEMKRMVEAIIRGDVIEEDDHDHLSVPVVDHSRAPVVRKEWRPRSLNVRPSGRLHRGHVFAERRTKRRHSCRLEEFRQIRRRKMRKHLLVAAALACGVALACLLLTSATTGRDVSHTADMTISKSMLWIPRLESQEETRARKYEEARARMLFDFDTLHADKAPRRRRRRRRVCKFPLAGIVRPECRRSRGREPVCMSDVLLSWDRA